MKQFFIPLECSTQNSPFYATSASEYQQSQHLDLLQPDSSYWRILISICDLTLLSCNKILPFDCQWSSGVHSRFSPSPCSSQRPVAALAHDNLMTVWLGNKWLQWTVQVQPHFRFHLKDHKSLHFSNNRVWHWPPFIPQIVLSTTHCLLPPKLVSTSLSLLFFLWLLSAVSFQILPLDPCR